MGCKRNKIVYLPKEIIEEILSRLPVKPVSRFRCVSKRWLSLISSEGFIEAHRLKWTKNTALSLCHHKVIFKDWQEDVFKQCSVHELLNEASIEPRRIHDPTNNELLIKAYAVGCCNGLLCLRLYSRPMGGLLLLWNPATRMFMGLPSLDGIQYSKFGFGCDGKSGAYKVFALTSDRGIKKGNLYSSKTNSWKAVDPGCLDVYNDNGDGVFSCGKIYWLTKSVDYIESFDLGSEEFGRIELPCFPFPYTTKEQFRCTLADIGGCLHLVCVYVHDQLLSGVVCVMKEEIGWLELFTFPPPVSEHRYVPPCPVYSGGPNGEILLKAGEKFLFYDGKDVSVLRVSKEMSYLHRGLVYVETLVSPNFTTPS